MSAKAKFSVAVFLCIPYILQDEFIIETRFTMDVSSVFFDHIKLTEGLRLESYLDTGNVWTIGFGHTKGVMPGQEITIDKAKKLLIEDVADVVNDLNRLHPVLTQGQFDALASFIFNIGLPQYLESTIYELVKADPFDPGIPPQFARWKYDNGVVKNGLITRRQREASIYVSGRF